MARRRAAHRNALSPELVARVTDSRLSTVYQRSKRWGFGSEAWGLTHAVGHYFAEWGKSRGLNPALCEKVAHELAKRSAEEWAELFDSGKKWLAIELLSGKVFLQEESATYGTSGETTGWFVLNLEHAFDTVAKAVQVELRRAAASTIAETN